jgi:hypothetical protein
VLWPPALPAIYTDYLAIVVYALMGLRVSVSGSVPLFSLGILYQMYVRLRDDPACGVRQ